ncbi:MAG: Rrf2 family transcriptional regulator [Candidatus Omnitrophica bacterium]|nr:Rrf2 family transcriptional regulator [Candidatus Omnitrophota bacterium]
MKISTRSRYGSRLMLELALNYGKGPVFLRDIAKNEEISEKYLSQIVIPLKAKGLITSFRGMNGGYVLAKSPSQINLREIVELLEGGLELLGCIGNSSTCSRVAICVTRDIWDLVGKKIAQILESVTLEDLIKSHNLKNEEAMIYSI